MDRLLREVDELSRLIKQRVGKNENCFRVDDRGSGLAELGATISYGRVGRGEN